MRSRIQTVGFIVPAVSLQYHLFHFDTYGQMAQDVPGAGGESRPPRQGSTLLGREV